MHRYKYLIAYLAPISAFIGLYFKGWWSFGSIYIGFLFIPAVEGLFYKNPDIDDAPTGEPKKSFLHDLFLCLNIPIVYSLIYYYAFTINTFDLVWYEHFGLVLNVGLILGTSGINVAHELGHRKEKIHHWMSWALLLPSHYLHFFIEHNKGHHRYIATLDDPATARKDEPIYSFWLRSVKDSYWHAWAIEKERLELQHKKVWSTDNLMILFLLSSLAYLGFFILVFNLYVAVMIALVGIIGLLFLESVNYIEHYGLLRKSTEPVHEGLSWDADQPLGRIFLYELTRHADHHTNASKPYQTLQASYRSPKMAYGYPASIILALIPHLWFKIMNPRLK